MFSANEITELPSCTKLKPKWDDNITFKQFLDTVKCIPDPKAPVIDGIIAEVLKAGIKYLILLLFPFYKVIRAYGAVPTGRNTAALHLI